MTNAADSTGRVTFDDAVTATFSVEPIALEARRALGRARRLAAPAASPLPGAAVASSRPATRRHGGVAMFIAGLTLGAAAGLAALMPGPRLPPPALPPAVALAPAAPWLPLAEALPTLPAPGAPIALPAALRIEEIAVAPLPRLAAVAAVAEVARPVPPAPLSRVRRYATPQAQPDGFDGSAVSAVRTGTVIEPPAPARPTSPKPEPKPDPVPGFTPEAPVPAPHVERPPPPRPAKPKPAHTPDPRVTPAIGKPGKAAEPPGHARRDDADRGPSRSDPGGKGPGPRAGPGGADKHASTPGRSGRGAEARGGGPGHSGKGSGNAGRGSGHSGKGSGNTGRGSGNSGNGSGNSGKGSGSSGKGGGKR